MPNFFQGANGAQVLTPGNGSGSAGFSSGANPVTAGGFSFTAPPLMLNGQNVSGNFNFDLPLAAPASITQAFNFIGGATSAADSFLGATDSQTNADTFGLFAMQTNFLNQIGTS